MSIIDKIVAKVAQPARKLGPADRQVMQRKEELARFQRNQAERARMAEDEKKHAAADREHAEHRREAFIGKERPTASALAVFDADQEVELQKRVIERTKPKPVQLNDGTYGAHPAVTKLTLLKAALKAAIEAHERMKNLPSLETVAGLQRMSPTQPSFGKDWRY
jgi:hypothetical protein